MKDSIYDWVYGLYVYHKDTGHTDLLTVFINKDKADTLCKEYNTFDNYKHFHVFPIPADLEEN